MKKTYSKPREDSVYMLTRSDGLKVTSAQRVYFRIGSSERDSMSSNSVWARPLNCNQPTWLVDSKIKIVSSGDGDNESCKSSSFNKTHIWRLNE